MKPSMRACAGLSALGAFALLLVAAPAAAQDDPPPPTTVAAAPAPAVVAEPKVPSMSIALERVGGIAYAKASSDKEDNSVSVTGIGIGGVTPNPFAIPRVGVDFILGSGLTLGGALGFSHVSGSVNAKTKSEDVGSVFLYTATPRIGYRIQLSDRVDLTPRAGVTLAGASISSADDRTSAGIFAVALGADAPFAFRLTDSFNLLAGVGADYTVSATVSSESRSTTVVSGPGGTTTTSGGTVKKEEDVKGSLFSLQAWLGIGGYL